MTITPLQGFMYSMGRVFEGLRNLTENFESTIDAQRMRLDLLAYYAKNFGYQIDYEDLDKQRSFVDLAVLYTGQKCTYDSYKALMRSYGYKCDIAEIYFSRLLYGVSTDGDLELTAGSSIVKQSRMVNQDYGGNNNPLTFFPCTLINNPYASGHKSIVQITGSMAFTDYYSPYGKQVITITGAASDADNGDHTISYAVYDGTYTNVYLADYVFEVPGGAAQAQFKDHIRQWAQIDTINGTILGSLYVDDQLNIPTLSPSVYNIKLVYTDTDGLPVMMIDPASPVSGIIKSYENPPWNTSYPSPSAWYSVIMNPDRAGYYDDIASAYSTATYFDTPVDDPLIQATNQFLISFVNPFDIATLADALLSRIERRVNAMIPLGTEFGGFGYRIQYVGNDKISMSSSDYDNTRMMTVGTRMSGKVTFNGSGANPNQLAGIDTKFLSEINVDDYIVIGFANSDASPYDYFVRIAKISGIDSDTILYLVDNLPAGTPFSPLSIAKLSYSKLVSRYHTGSGSDKKYFIRSYIPSSEYPDAVSYDWPMGTVSGFAVGDVTCVGVSSAYTFDFSKNITTPPYPDTNFYIDAVNNGAFVQSIAAPVTKLDRLVFFVLFEITKT